MNRLKDLLDRLDGNPPYNIPSNQNYGDGYFAQSIEKEFGASIDELRKRVQSKPLVPRSILKHEIRGLLKKHGMEKVLEALIMAVPRTRESYILRLRKSLDEILTDYRNRHEGSE